MKIVKSKIDKIIVQTSLIVCISVFLFICLYWAKFSFDTQELIIIVPLGVLAVGFVIASFGRYKDVSMLYGKIEILTKEAKKHRADTHMILDILPDMVYIVDKTKHIIWANRSLLALDKNAIGKIPDEIFGFYQQGSVSWQFGTATASASSIFQTKNIPLSKETQHSAPSSATSMQNSQHCTQGELIDKSIDSKQVEKSVVFYPANPDNDAVGSNFRPEEAKARLSDTYLEHYCVPIKDLQAEDVTSLAVLSANITSKIQFYETRERLNAIVKASKDAIFVIDANRRIVSWNSSAENIFGYSNAEIIGQNITMLDHLIDFNTLVSIFDINEIIETHAIKHVEFVELRTKNVNYIVDFTLYPFFDEKGIIIGISVIVRDRTETMKAKQALELRELQMRKLALHIDAVREEERKQIAFVIHDDLGYALSALKMDISWLQGRTFDYVNQHIDIQVDKNRALVKERLDDMLGLVDITIKKVKTLSANLRPSILDHFGLIAAIEEQSKEFQRRTGIRCKVNVSPAAEELNIAEHLRTPIFRIFQEAQTNITRYAKASRVDVDIDYIDNVFTMNVQDNGMGIPSEKINSIESFGLLGIREKATSIGGKAIISGKKNEGTSVCLEVKI